MKAAAGIAFSALDQNSRVGFHTLWENEHAVHERQGLHDARTSRPGSPTLYKVSPERRHAAAGRDVAHRRALLGQSGGLRPARAPPIRSIR